MIAWSVQAKPKSADQDWDKRRNTKGGQEKRSSPGTVLVAESTAPCNSEIRIEQAYPCLVAEIATLPSVACESFF